MGPRTLDTPLMVIGQVDSVGAHKIGVFGSASVAPRKDSADSRA